VSYAACCLTKLTPNNMRNLVIERITELWDEDAHPFEFGTTLDKLEELSNRELLDMFEDLVGFSG
jgi:hypothetical protein